MKAFEYPDSGPLTVCPCCGKHPGTNRDRISFVCVSCATLTNAGSWPGGSGTADEIIAQYRTRAHEEGKRLRDQGILPPLGKPTQVLTSEFQRGWWLSRGTMGCCAGLLPLCGTIPRGAWLYCTGAPGNVFCEKHALEARAVNGGSAATLKQHHDIQAAKMVGVCGHCGATPCDCEKAIWTVWTRSHNDNTNKTAGQQGRRPRADMMKWRTSSMEVWSKDYDYGPVQRVSDGNPFANPLAGMPIEVTATRGDHTQAVTMPKPLEVHDVLGRIERRGLDAMAQCYADKMGSRSFTQEQLARALFDLGPVVTEACKLAEETRYVDVETHEKQHKRYLHVLDVMWSGKDGKGGTKPAERKAAEDLAAAIFARK
jgi:hypothetical protein